MTKLAEKADMHTTRERVRRSGKTSKENVEGNLQSWMGTQALCKFLSKEERKGGKKEKSEGRKLFEIQSEEKNSKSKFGDFRSVSTF